MRLSFFAIAILLLAGQAQADISLAAGGNIQLGADRPLDLAASRSRELSGKIELVAGNISLSEGGSLLIVGSTAPLVIESPLSAATPVRPPQSTTTEGGGTINFIPFDIGNSPSISIVQPDSGLAALRMAAVPEPKNYAMLLAGLALMGFIARRRNAR
ncbi:PEP-CTERM sorting domain-containing protein [Dechloromonas denitrificans]|uniref:PEP-CTERM sorting domain-containing protein n=1 Tax=Dechloromonas denitrificans TaxID=281362 RepID=UPI001CF85F03|nr:PEP-CTERM sorting domain-containing protein [Dechloromonas denitrificans]UCV05429.1 PEP-CTERM sorting domain-containing protein [Dechloromonas denitrificans]